MRKILRLDLLTFTLLCLLGAKSLFAISNAEIGKIKKEFEAKTRKYTLSNGIRVILFQNKVSPTVACYIKIGVGSANEPFDQAGTAHFLEHLLFKGTPVIGTTDFKKEKPYLDEIERLGNEIDLLRLKIRDPVLDSKTIEKYKDEISKLSSKLKRAESNAQKFVISEEDSKIYSLAGQIGYNAYTTEDVTNYQIKLPKNRLELWAYLESSRFIEPIFREYYQEREVIQEERRMRFDSNPKAKLYEMFNSEAFGFSPYGKPVIGFANNLPYLTLEDTKNYYYKYYTPARMVIAISGDIDFKETLGVVRKYFEKIPKRDEPRFPPISYALPDGRRTAVLDADSTPYMITGWSKPAVSDPDNPVYEILSRILAHGRSSRLFKKLVIQERIAQSVAAYSGVPAEKLENQFAVFTEPYNEKDYKKIYKMILKEVNDIKKNGVSEKEILRVKNMIFKELIDSLDSNAGMADTMSYYELLLHDYNYLFTYMEQVQRITSDDIKRVANKTFVEKNNTTVWIHQKRKQH